MDKFDYTNVDYEGFKRAMIKGLTETMPEYTDTSETDAGVIILELLARGLDVINYYQNRQANECFLPTAERRENVLTWSKMLGYVPKSFVSAILTEMVSVKDPSQISMPKGTLLRTKVSDVTEQPIYFTTEVNLTETDGQGNYKYFIGYEVKDSEGVIHSTSPEKYVEGDEIVGYLFRIPVIHGIYIENELISTSDGSEGLTCTLAETPVDLDKLVVSVKSPNSASAEVWERVDSFIDSTPTSKHYTAQVLDDDTVQITFGDNRTGKIPEAESIIRASYLNGGGTVGNVGEKTITEMVTPISGVNYVYNLEQFSENTLNTDRYGVNKETNESIKVNAPNHYRTAWGCLTVGDYADRLLEVFPQFKFADSIRTSNDVDGVDVYCVKYDIQQGKLVEGFEDLRKGSDGKYLNEEVQQIAEMYEERQLIGTHVNFKNTEFLSQNIVATLYVYDETLREATETEIKEKLNYYFNSGEYLGYRTPVSVIDLEAEVISAISNVRAFRIQSIGGESSVIVECRAGKILTLGKVTISNPNSGGA